MSTTCVVVTQAEADLRSDLWVLPYKDDLYQVLETLPDLASWIQICKSGIGVVGGPRPDGRRSPLRRQHIR